MFHRLLQGRRVPPIFCRIQKKYSPKIAPNTFFIILYEMGLEDRDVRRIMGITQETFRST